MKHKALPQIITNCYCSCIKIIGTYFGTVSLKIKYFKVKSFSMFILLVFGIQEITKFVAVF